MLCRPQISVPVASIIPCQGDFKPFSSKLVLMNICMVARLLGTRIRTPSSPLSLNSYPRKNLGSDGRQRLHVESHPFIFRQIVSRHLAEHANASRAAHTRNQSSSWICRHQSVTEGHHSISISVLASELVQLAENLARIGIWKDRSA